MSPDIVIVDSEGFHGIANTSESSRDADVVFVHGLGGTSHATWRHGIEGSAGHFFWPASLAEDLPRCGVWTVGYPAGLTALGKPGMIIEKRAGNLAQKLANAGLGARPLVFIAHSMGGLVLKSLIVGSQTLADADRKRIVGMIRCIVFCATPHRGSAFADAAGVLGAFFGGSQDHVDEMRANAEPLDILHDEFIEWQRVHQVPVQSYAENVGLFRARRWFLPPVPLGLVVPRASANPGIAGHTVRDVDDDHLSLVKPRDRKHDVYAGVLRFIRESLDSAPAGQQATERPKPPVAAQSSSIAATVVGRPRVYLSYTLRTPGLRERVFELAERLRASGIDSRIDLYYAKSLHGFIPPDPVPNQDSWAAWQVEQVRDADRVLILCTKEFNESPEGSGAWFDVELMKQDVESGAELRKFIPIGYGDFEVNRTFIPAFIRGATYYDLTAATISGFGFEDLVRRFQNEFRTAEKSEVARGGPGTRASLTELQPAMDVYNRALRSLSGGDYDAALKGLDQALEIDSTMAPAYYNRGLTHYLKGDDDLAINDFARAVRLGFNDALLFRNRANAYSRKGDVARALADYEQAIELEPGNPLAYLNRGEIYENTLQRDLAIAEYKTVLGLVCEPRWHDKARERLIAMGVAV
jgi:tetratricopeptide (TPR) repeat protein